MTDGLRPAPPPSDAVAAAEAEIAQTRRRLDEAIDAARSDLALPIAVLAAIAAMLEGVGDAKQLGAFLKRNAAPLGIIALGAGWLAVQNREALGEIGERYGRELLERARAVGNRAAAAAVSAALDEIGRPDGQAEDSS